jgi:hypothetical protein
MIYSTFTPSLRLKRAERYKIAQWAILAKEPACREGDGGWVKKRKKYI